MAYKRYKNELDYSYALGAATVIELLARRPDLARAVYISPDYQHADIAAICAGQGLPNGDITAICAGLGLPCEINRKIFNIVADKENIFVIGVFDKRETALEPGLPHIVFVNPADAGNLGTNLRTCLGFGFRDVAVIRPGADVFSPKTVRASMGAVFGVRARCFASFGDYAAAFPDHEKYLFALKGETELGEIAEIGVGGNGVGRNGVNGNNVSGNGVGGSGCGFSLVFGNEATGLPDELLRFGRGVRIAHSNDIDSLNLSVAVGIAANAFYSLRNRAE